MRNQLPDTEWGRLPGWEIVEPGLKDLREGRESIEALAVAMAATRLRAVGLDIDAGPTGAKPASHRLYELLAAEHGSDAHSRYNAIAGRIASFARAAETLHPAEHASSG